MKYITLILVLSFLVTACSSKQPRTFICMSALTPLGGIEINTASDQVKESVLKLTLTTDAGNVIVIPKSLCVEVRRAEGN